MPTCLGCGGNTTPAQGLACAAYPRCRRPGPVVHPALPASITGEGPSQSNYGVPTVYVPEKTLGGGSSHRAPRSGADTRRRPRTSSPPALSEDVLASLARMGISTESRPRLTAEERAAAEADRQFIGFANPTLLLCTSETRFLYTNGLSGCLAMILSSSQATYMAHIFTANLSKKAELIERTAKILLHFATQAHGPPTTAALCAREQETLDSLSGLVEFMERRSDLKVKLVRHNEIGVIVGSVDLGLLRLTDIVGRFSIVQESIEAENLMRNLPALQWPYPG